MVLTPFLTPFLAPLVGDEENWEIVKKHHTIRMLYYSGVVAFFGAFGLLSLWRYKRLVKTHSPKKEPSKS